MDEIETSDPRRMEVKLTALLGNYDTPDRATDRRQTDRQGHREVSLSSTYSLKSRTFCLISITELNCNRF